MCTYTEWSYAHRSLILHLKISNIMSKVLRCPSATVLSILMIGRLAQCIASVCLCRLTARRADASQFIVFPPCMRDGQMFLQSRPPDARQLTTSQLRSSGRQGLGGFCVNQLGLCMRCSCLLQGGCCWFCISKPVREPGLRISAPRPLKQLVPPMLLLGLHDSTWSACGKLRGSESTTLGRP